MNQLDPHIFLQKIQQANVKTIISFQKQNTATNEPDEKLSELVLIQHCQELQTRSDQTVNIIKNCQQKIDMKEPLETLLECEKLLLWGNFLVKSLDNIDESNLSTDSKLILIDKHRYSDRFLESSIRILLLFDKISEIFTTRINQDSVKDIANKSEIETSFQSLFVVGVVMFFLCDSMSLKKAQALAILKHELNNFENFQKNSAEKDATNTQIKIGLSQFSCIVEDMSKLQIVAVEPTVELVTQLVNSNSECKHLLNNWIFNSLTTAKSSEISQEQNGINIWRELVQNGIVEYDMYSMCAMCSSIQLDAETIDEIYYGRNGNQKHGSKSMTEGVVAQRRRMVLDSVTRMVLQGRLVCHVEQAKDAYIIVFEDADKIDAEKYLARVLDELEQL